MACCAYFCFLGVEMCVCVCVCVCVYMRVRVCSFVECWGCLGTDAETFPGVLSGRRLYAAEHTEKGGGHPWTFCA